MSEKTLSPVDHNRLLIENIKEYPVYWIREGIEDYIQFGANIDNYKYWVGALKKLPKDYTFATQCGLIVTKEDAKRIILKVETIKDLL